MMMFRTVKTALVTTLGDHAEGRFRVIGHQKQSKASDEVTGNNRVVQVYYSGGDFPMSGRMRGPKRHDLTFEIDMTASAGAKGDLSVLDSDTATAQQKAAALIALRNAAEVADTQVDELIEYVYQILNDARLENLGLEKGDIASRWIGKIQKDTLLERGDLVVKTANMKYTCRVVEDVPGDIGVEPDTVIVDSTIDIDGTSGAGVINQIDNT